MPRVRIDASVHRLLSGRECESRSQNQLHFEVLRARLMQQTFRRDFALLESMLSGPEIDKESPRGAQQQNALRGVGFWPLGLRTALGTPRNLGSRHEKPGLLLLMAPIVRGRKARRIDCQASLELVDPRHALEDREELCEII